MISLNDACIEVANKNDARNTKFKGIELTSDGNDLYYCLSENGFSNDMFEIKNNNFDNVKIHLLNIENGKYFKVNENNYNFFKKFQMLGLFEVPYDYINK